MVNPIFSTSAIQAMGLLLRLITIDESVFCTIFPQPVRVLVGFPMENGWKMGIYTTQLIGLREKLQENHGKPYIWW